MPFNSVILRPGVNTNLTLALNEAGVSVSNLVRYKDALIQKLGGWEPYYAFQIGSTVKDLHPWAGISGNNHLGVGATQSLSVITAGSNQDITPQTETRDFTPDFSVSSGSNVVTIVDAGSSANTYQTVFFNTQVSVGTLLLSGAYKVNSVGGSSSFTIMASANSCTTVVSSGILPGFNASSGSAIITVTLPNNNYQDITGFYYPFIAPSSVGGLTIQGPYQINSIIDSTQFTISALSQASTTSSASMNGGLAQLVYYRVQGPAPAGSGYGIGGYGLGGYGTGAGTTGGSTGIPITATDWSQDNFGSVLVACPEGGPIYVWSEDSGFATAEVIPQAPFFNGGIFVSMPQQILVAWRSCLTTGVQDPLTVRWCDAEDYTNWTVSNQTTAGSFRIPTGSRIIGALQAPTQAMIWTDVDAWVMQYVGGQVIFNFNRVGSGCGLVGQHAAGTLQGLVFWMGPNNFYTFGGKGVQTIPCTVWDYVFQNIDLDNIHKVVCAVNSMFNEVAWYFPSAGSSGENDSYVKLNLDEGAWDYGTLDRTAWTDASIIGNPIGSDVNGFIQEHEEGNDAGSVPMVSSFQTGYWRIQEGNEIAFVDWILPDMKFGSYSGAQNATVNITLYAVNYLGDTPTAYGPYPFTATTKWLNVRVRGRFLSMKIESQDSGSYWRIGRINYRWAPAGRL